MHSVGLVLHPQRDATAAVNSVLAWAARRNIAVHGVGAGGAVEPGDLVLDPGRPRCSCGRPRRARTQRPQPNLDAGAGPGRRSAHQAAGRGTATSQRTRRVAMMRRVALEPGTGRDARRGQVSRSPLTASPAAARSCPAWACHGPFAAPACDLVPGLPGPAGTTRGRFVLSAAAPPGGPVSW